MILRLVLACALVGGLSEATGAGQTPQGQSPATRLDLAQRVTELERAIESLRAEITALRNEIRREPSAVSTAVPPLTRQRAEELIRGRLGNTVETIKLFKRYYVRQSSSAGNVGLVHYGTTANFSEARPMLDSYRSAKLIDLRGLVETRNRVSFEWAVVALTAEGAKYLVREDDSQFELKACDVTFGAVTGIQTNDLLRAAEATYTLQKTAPTPFATQSCHASEVRVSKSTFALYDDGWRIER